LYIWSGWWPLSDGVLSRGILAVSLVLVSVRVFVGPRWWVRLGCRIGHHVVVVVVMLVVECSGKWWSTRHDIVVLVWVLLFWLWWAWLRWQM